MSSLLLLALASAQAQTPIRCCDHPEIEKAVAGVAAVAAALAKDPDGGDRELQALRTAFRVPSDLPKAERDALNGIRRAAKAQGMKPDGPDLGLPYLTRQAVFLALRHEGGDLVVAEGWCSARGGWLQTDLDDLRRPWKGCGAWK